MSNFAFLNGQSEYSARAVGALAAAAMVTLAAGPSHFNYTADRFLINKPYIVLQNPDTAMVGGASYIEDADMSFEAGITNFYEKLTKAQQPLGEEFQAVLTANLWDLYAE